MHKKLIRAPKTTKQVATDVDFESAINGAHTHTHTNSATLKWPFNTPLFTLELYPRVGGNNFKEGEAAYVRPHLLIKTDSDSTQTPRPRNRGATSDKKYTHAYEGTYFQPCIVDHSLSIILYYLVYPTGRGDVDFGETGIISRTNQLNLAVCF